VALCTMLAGALFLSFVISTLIEVLGSAGDESRRAQRYLKKMALVDSWLSAVHLPRQLSSKMYRCAVRGRCRCGAYLLGDGGCWACRRMGAWCAGRLVLQCAVVGPGGVGAWSALVGGRATAHTLRLQQCHSPASLWPSPPPGGR
jgi:hypothetical protein